MSHGIDRSSSHGSVATDCPREPRRLLSRRLLREHGAHIGVLGVLVAAAGFVACGDSPAPTTSMSPVDNPALVTLDLRDSNQQHIGSCSGVLISPTAVLTAGHCVVASGGVQITTADGRTATGYQYWTTWENFESSWSHPQHSDVAVILANRPLPVSSYPTISSTIVSDGTSLARLRRADSTSMQAGNFEQVTSPVHYGTGVGFPLAYTMDMSFEGQIDTGGPVIDPNTNTIYGVVSGRGTTTGNVYVSRVEFLADWANGAATCTPPSIQEQCHPKPPPPPCDGGGSSSSGSGGGASSSGSSGGGNSSGGSGGWSSSGGSGSGGSSGGSGSSSGGWSSSGSSSGAGSGSGGGSSGGGGDDGGTCGPPPPPPPPPPPTTTDGSCGSSSGGVTSSSGAGSGSSSGGTQTSSGSSGSGWRMPQPGNPLIPDGPGCYDYSCGGCGTDPSCQDGQQDYGDCGCQPAEAGPTQ